MRCWPSVSVCTDFGYSPPIHRSGDRTQRRVHSSQLWWIGYTIVMVLMGSARVAVVEAVWRRTAVVRRGSSKTGQRNTCGFTTTWQSISTHSCRDDARSVNFVRRRRSTITLAHSSKQPIKKQVVKNTYESEFLDEVEGAVDAILLKHQNQNILDLPPVERESLGVAIPLRIRMDALTRNGDCRRCWLQRAHCICHECPGLESESSSSPTVTAETNGPVVLPNIRRLFLLTHHKEICLAVDTAKMILAAFPQTCRLVVSGMGPEYQPSMSELMKVLYPDSKSADDGYQKRTKCLVLFPSEDARTFQEIVHEEKQNQREQEQEQDYPHKEGDEEWDIVVIDGTWSQARKMYNRYIPPENEGGPIRVKLSNEAVALLEQSEVLADPNWCDDNSLIPGHQLRRHPIKWREVSTLEATRLLLRDIIVTAEDASGSPTSNSSPKPWDTLASYQIRADKAAQKQLGPPRRR
uniref:tRNA-uridine aminocarboxypropyltransferase n=1 Tax=Attheya septentrionalis TaxID=420275 RepID=A0A7S2U8R9_9STRA|mmetsp:Transcript_14769/g.26800  ORF Transcript_14769/g.26800 Transcript_14769/m.26800 type:complete len:465 (+) Transcript_14769:214-1608(+)